MTHERHPIPDVGQADEDTASAVAHRLEDLAKDPSLPEPWQRTISELANIARGVREHQALLNAVRAACPPRYHSLDEQDQFFDRGARTWLDRIERQRQELRTNITHYAEMAHSVLLSAAEGHPNPNMQTTANNDSLDPPADDDPNDPYGHLNRAYLTRPRIPGARVPSELDEYQLAGLRQAATALANRTVEDRIPERRQLGDDAHRQITEAFLGQLLQYAYAIAEALSGELRPRLQSLGASGKPIDAVIRINIRRAPELLEQVATRIATAFPGAKTRTHGPFHADWPEEQFIELWIDTVFDQTQNGAMPPNSS